MLRPPGIAREEARIRARARELATLVDLEAVAGVRVADLPFGTQKRVELARALASDPKLLVQDLLAIMRTVNREEGVSILLVEQNAKLALDLADTAYLLETGRVVMGGPAVQLRDDETVRRAYLGY